MSSATALRLVLATAVVLLQFFIAQTDHLCGLSGADSLVRGLAASVDATSAGLFLAGAYTFAFKGPPSRQEVRDYLQRWSKLHSDPVQNRKAGLKIDIRSNRFPRFTTITRVGKIQVRSRDVSNGPALRYEYEDRELVENYSSFIVPYMLRKDRRFISCGSIIDLNPDALRGAGAISVARFATFISWSIILWAVKMGLIVYLTLPSWWQVFVYATSETSRSILVLCQVSSVFTYSLQYKGISSWASPSFKLAPDNEARGGRAGPYWEHFPKVQQVFEANVIEGIGWNLPALILFYLAKGAWAHQPGWLARTQVCGPTIFSRFADPPVEAYSDQASVDVKLRVFEGHEIDSLTERDPVYTIEFTHVPKVITIEMETSLFGGAIYRSFVFAIGLFSLSGIVAPVTFAVLHRSPSFQICWTIAQIVVLALKFDDPSNMSINTELAARENSLVALLDSI